MGTQTNITLNTSDVYTPAGRDANGVATWLNRADSAAYPGRITQFVASSPNQQNNVKVQLKFDMPQLVAEDSSCGCAGALKAKASYNGSHMIPSSFSAAERTAYYQSLSDLYGNAAVQSALEDLEGAW